MGKKVEWLGDWLTGRLNECFTRLFQPTSFFFLTFFFRVPFVSFFYLHPFPPPPTMSISIYIQRRKRISSKGVIPDAVVERKPTPVRQQSSVGAVTASAALAANRRGPPMRQQSSVVPVDTADEVMARRVSMGGGRMRSGRGGRMGECCVLGV